MNALRALSGSAPVVPVGPPGAPLELVDTGTGQVLTFDDPVANGMPPTSGYAADPVCTATGHLVEVEIDLDAPPAAALLTVTRVHGSRHARPGPLGRGWSSWASTRLEAGPDGVLFTGPDGRRAHLTRTADGYGRVPGIAAELVDSPGGGWRMSWFAGDTWRFAATGRPVAVEDARGAGATTFTWDDDRLVAVTAPNGRRLDVEWDGERIVAVRTDDGRSVRYRYDGPVT